MGAPMTTDADADADAVDAEVDAGVASILTAGSTIDEREARLVGGAEGLEGARESILSHPRLLLGASATLMTTGVCAVVLGWLGAANSTLVEEQVPYLISGGLLGVALSTIGALLFFSHWLTVAVKEARRHEEARRQDHQQLVEELRALGVALARGGGVDGNARGEQPGRAVRRTSRRS